MVRDVTKRRTPWGPREFIAYGVLVALVGGVIGAAMASDGSGNGVLVLSIVGVVAGIMISIGVIAEGVHVGLHAHKADNLIRSLDHDL